MKATIWDSIKDNPKVLFIAFFASYESLPRRLDHIANHSPGSVVSNMATNRVFLARVW
jgi:hypothetical protein